MPLTTQIVDGNLAALAIQLRNTHDAIRLRMVEINKLGLAGLVALGFSGSPNPANPGGVSDAQLRLDRYGYLSTNAGVYYGTVQQGGSGGTGASTFNFDDALSPVWGGN
jgi:hypothetical protein